MSTGRPEPVRVSNVFNVAIIVLGLVAIAVMLLVRLVSDSAMGPARPLDLAIRWRTVAEGFDQPILLVGDGRGNRYVVEQRGRIVRLGDDGRPDTEPLLDIADRVLYEHERGLLGLAFHPGFARNGRLFVAYSRRDDGATSISQFSLPLDAPDGETVAIEDSERALLTIPQPYTTHKAGMLAFDEAGMLLVAVGDGGSSGDPMATGQDRASLLGKLLRLDVDRGWPYAAPPDNGFADDRAARPEIHAIGLRNPWRFSLDRESGDVYIGDVGQDGWEEVNVLRPGQRQASFGWSQMEGRACYADRACEPGTHVLPALAYPHVEDDVGHCSVIGGYAYRGSTGMLPAGAYLYADYCSSTVWAVPADDLVAGRAVPAVVARLPAELGQPLSFGEDDAGELYLLTSAGLVLGLSSADPA